jgi:hypothetical protein
MRKLVLELTRKEWDTHRQKRGIFNLVGHVAHSLFGMLDSENEEFYNQQIAQLEREQLELLQLIREQTTVVRSTLKSLNKTLHDVSHNELTLAGELQEILEFMNVRNKKIEIRYALIALLLTLNDHVMRIRQAVEVRDVYDTVIQVYLHGKSEIMQPQVLSPIRLMQILEMSKDSFPRYLEIRVALSEAYAYVLFDTVSVDVYFVEHNLVYSVRVPLVMHSVFDVFRIIPFPSQVKGTDGRFTLIQPQKEFILIDSTKGVYAKLEQKDIQLCKQIHLKTLICKQDFPLSSSHSTTDCEAVILQPMRFIPQSCTQRILDLKETLWIPLGDNAWIYVAPVPEHLTVLCEGQKPTDVEIVGSGVFTFLSACTGYGNVVIIRSVSIHSVNKTGEDIMPPMNFDT